ncbi:hypothetical protein J2X36_002158 [Methylobacterium sp. BE186]|uniref:hypothetical protein n=1 Tax=Methylobacterium sp. BE186 TaxID=2817715 RepID=UPI0028598664|nr:hypothetical protein [Methylobacterium sp. BE186]MDR7037411.1 hypothetical protein [Methylobacterium sp. BE186]
MPASEKRPKPLGAVARLMLGMNGPLAPYAGPYSTYRLFEWYMAVTMVLIAFTLALPGNTMERAALKPMVAAGFTEANLATFFAAVGAVRVLALFLNGKINNSRGGPAGAYIRAFCAAGGCIIMGQLTFALVYDAFTATSPSFFIPVLGTAAGFEALSVYIAVLDAAKRRGTRLGRALDQLEKAV